MAEKVTPRILTGPGGERLIATGEVRPPKIGEWFIGIGVPVGRCLCQCAKHQYPSYEKREILRLPTPEEVEAAEKLEFLQEAVPLAIESGHCPALASAVAEETQPEPHKRFITPCRGCGEDHPIGVGCRTAAPSPAGEERGASAEESFRVIPDDVDKLVLRLVRTQQRGVHREKFFRYAILEFMRAASPHARDGVPGQPPEPRCPKCQSRVVRVVFSPRGSKNESSGECYECTYSGGPFEFFPAPSAEPPVWYKREEFVQTLRDMKYHEDNCQELADWLMENITLAFRKGYQVRHGQEYPSAEEMAGKVAEAVVDKLLAWREDFDGQKRETCIRIVTAVIDPILRGESEGKS